MTAETEPIAEELVLGLPPETLAALRVLADEAGCSPALYAAAILAHEATVASGRDGVAPEPRRASAG